MANTCEQRRALDKELQAISLRCANPRPGTAAILTSALILTENLAGLVAQGLGLAEAAGLASRLHPVVPRRPWAWVPAATWPAPLRAVGGVEAAASELIVSVGGVGGAVGAALKKRGNRVVQVQNPRISPRHFDLVIANAHDELTGDNVLISRTALHRVTQERLAAERMKWLPHFAAFKRPLVAVLLGGSNGRYTFDAQAATQFAAELADVARHDGATLALTPSRRTGPEATAILRRILEPQGAWLWDMQGENPYFGLLACADAIIVTADSISMISEAAATHAPVLVKTLQGKSRRGALFLDTLVQAGRVRRFNGRLEDWAAEPLNDMPAIAQEVRKRLGLD